MIKRIFILIWCTCNYLYSQQYENVNTVISFTQGPDHQGFAISPERSNPTKALGNPEDNDNLNVPINFVSLGFGGEIILKINYPLDISNSLSILQIFETTWGYSNCNIYPETANIYVSKDNVNWYFLGTTCLNDNTIYTPNITGLDTLLYIKVKDISPVNRFQNFNFTSDGYDLDGVKIFDLGPLPVELLYLNLTEQIDGVLVNWASGSETNNNYYTLYFSKDLSNFVELTRLVGNGNTSFTSYYNYYHFVSKKNTHYYKLTQTDFNGETKILKIAVISFNNKKKVLKIINLEGKEIDPDKYKGVIINIYEDGTFEKSITR
jgi:hypothetical protein